MARWDLSGVPHKGWIFVDCIDVKEDATDDDEIEYETCEMCQNEKIRYVHLLRHPDYLEMIRVGCVCAEKLTNNYETPRNRENALRNRAMRKKNFMKQEWYPNANGNLILKYKGECITAIQRYGQFRCVYQGRWTNDYHGRKITDLETLKMAAFEAFDDE